MAQISTGNLTTLMDRMARHAAELSGTPLASAIATGGAYAATSPSGGVGNANTNVLSAMVTSALSYADAAQMADLIPAISQASLAPGTSDNFLSTFWAPLRRALENHLGRYNSRTSTDLSYLDAALRVINANAITLRAHGAFAQYFGGVSAANVFTPTPYVIGTLTVTGATTATFAKTGMGGSTGLLDTSLYGPGQVALLNTKSEGLTSTTFVLTCLSSGVGVPVTIDVTSTTNNELTAGDVTTQTITGVTGLVSVAGGVSTDTFSIVILPDRCINAV